MNITNTEYQTMLKICQDGTFYFNDQSIGANLFRMFNYRLASYTDWLVDPITFEMRGLMVEIDSNGEFLRVASRPPAKFFNLNETPFVQNVDLSVGGVVNDKLDGSLMSTFWYMDINGVIQLGVKSKMSLISDQCVQTTEYLQQHPILRQELLDLARKGFTVYCEICGPDNRIVVGYQERKLTALGIRDNITGEELPPTTSSILSNGHWVNHFYSDDIASVVSGIDDLVGIEGYVIQLNSGIRFKIKSNWYLSLHHCKDSVNNPRRLFEAIVDEGVDDIRSMFHDDAWLINQIDEMQVTVDKLYNDMVSEVEHFYEVHKDLDRKTYAILGQELVTKMYFCLVMVKYAGKIPDYKTFLKSKYKELGFVDKAIKETVEE